MRKLLTLCLFALAFLPRQVEAKERIKEADLRHHIEILASDAFEGRKPGTSGEIKTVDYIVGAWKSAGLQPAAHDGSFVEPVALMQRAPGSSKINFIQKNLPLRFVGDSFISLSREASYKQQDLPVVFAGYGVKPDGGALDGLKGKIAMMLTERPEFVAESKSGLRSRIAAVASAGAAGVLLVAPSQTEWASMRRRWLSSPISLQSQDMAVPLETLVDAEYAVAMLTAAGRDWDKLRAHAKEASFIVEAMPFRANIDVSTQVRKFDSANIFSKIPGRKKGSGAVLFMAHWDHLGHCAANDDGDDICNGAVDNASGIAVLTEVARELRKQKHDRDIYFLATTAEESGLLGAKAFAANQSVVLNTLAVAFNLDTVAIAPAGAKVAIIGRGRTGLDKDIDKVVISLKRKPENSTASNEYIDRQDGSVLSILGVPAVMVGGSFADPVRLENFLGSLYHGPDDELTSQTDLSGAREDADLHVALGEYFASTRKYKGNRTGS